MARVIKPAVFVREVAVVKHDCGATVEFEKKDVQPDQRDGSYVVWPQCKKWIAASLLKWKKARKELTK